MSINIKNYASPTAILQDNIRSVALHLQKLESDLVDPILSQLQTCRVLELAIAGNDRFRETILHSPSWKHLFNSNTSAEHPELVMQELLEIYAIWTVLHDMSNGMFRISYGSQRHYWEYGLTKLGWNSFNYSGSPLYMFRAESKNWCKDQCIVRTLKKELEQLYKVVYRGDSMGGRLDAGAVICSKQYAEAAGIPEDALPLHNALTTEDWGRFVAAVDIMCRMQHAFRKVRVNEVLLLAQLVQEHPTRLKKVLDPREDAIRTSHVAGAVEQEFRSSAGRLERSGFFGSRIGQSLFRSLYLPVIPRDVCMHLLIRSLKENPLETYAYPKNIKEHIHTALEGVQYIYKASGRLQPRRLHIRRGNVPYPSYEPDKNNKLPPNILTTDDGTITNVSFEIPQEWDYRGRLADAHDSREVKWLEAFLNCVKYFEEEFVGIKDEVYSTEVPGKLSKLQRFGPRVSRWKKRENMKEARQEKREEFLQMLARMSIRGGDAPGEAG